MNKLLLICLIGYCAVGLPACKRSKEKLQNELLTHYKSPQDSLQRKAAIFLLDYIDGLYSGPSSEADSETIKAEYLIQNIDLAFQSASEDLKSGVLSFSDFCEYVLPYRLANEPLTPWRQQCIKHYSSLRDTFQVDTDQDIAIGKHINIDYYYGFKYSLKTQPARFKAWEQLFREKEGDCWAMTSLISYPLRALGIAVTTDFVPKWANSNGGPHAWNALKTAHHGWIPFMGCERYPAFPIDFDPFGIYYERRSTAKVFRQTYSINKETLPYLIADKENIPSHLSFDRVVDVTDQYLPVSDIPIAIKPDLKADVVYLATFSDGNWAPSYWAKPQNNTCVFRKMARGIMYLPCTYSSSEGLVPIGNPLYAEQLTGRIVVFKPDFNEKKPLSITYTQSKALDEILVYGRGLSGIPFNQAIDSVCLDLKRSKPLTDSTYRLYIWNTSWQLVGETKKHMNAPLRFENVPVKAIYRLLPENETKVERIFTYTNGQQVWW